MHDVKVNMERTSVNPGPAPISGMLASACNLAETALAMAMNINAHCFGIQPKEDFRVQVCLNDNGGIVLDPDERKKAADMWNRRADNG